MQLVEKDKWIYVARSIPVYHILYIITPVPAAEIRLIWSLSLSVAIWRDSYSFHIRLSLLSHVPQLLLSCSCKKFYFWYHNVYSLFLSPAFYSLYLTSNFTILLLADPCKPTIPFNALWLDLNLLFNSTRLREKYRRSRYKTSLQMSPPGFKTSSNPFYLAENDS